MTGRDKKATMATLAAEQVRQGEDMGRIFTKIGELLRAMVGSVDGESEGLVHKVENLSVKIGELKKEYDSHRLIHENEKNKVSEEIAVYDAGIQKNFKFVWIGLGVVGLIAIVGLWLGAGLPSAALKSAAAMIYDILGG